VSARLADATPLIYQGTGRAHVVHAAVAGVSASNPAWAGDYNWIWGGGTPPADYATYDPAFYTYCAEMFISLGSRDLAIKSTNVLSVPGVPDTGKVAWLFNTYAGAIHTQAKVAAEQNTDTRENAAALQVAIWKALLDPSNGLRDGTPKLNTSGPITSKAMQYLTTLYSGDLTGYNSTVKTWFDTQETRGQTLLPGVLEPGTLVLLGTGLVAVSTIRRRVFKAA
jgi:hypothetical protein